MPKRKREEDDNEISSGELIEKDFSAIPPELVALMLVDFNDQALCQAGTISRLFLIAANLVFRERFRQINQKYFDVAVTQLSNFKLAYFQSKTTFQNVVNAVVALGFPQRFADSEQRWLPTYIPPDQQIVEGKNGDLASYYYLPLIRTLQKFDPFDVLQAVLNVIDKNRAVYERISIALMEGFDSARRMQENQARGLLVHMFIGTMRYDVLRLLLDKGYYLNSCGPFGDRSKHTEGDSGIDVMLAVSSYYQKKEHRTDHGPSVEVLMLLSEIDVNYRGDNYIKAIFAGEKYIKDILEIIESDPDHAFTPSCLRLCAFLFLNNATGQYQEEDFVGKLFLAEKVCFENEKEVLSYAMKATAALQLRA